MPLPISAVGSLLPAWGALAFWPRKRSGEMQARGGASMLPAVGTVRVKKVGRFVAGVTRAFDILFSMALLAVLTPVMLLIAALIRLDSAGGTLYRQERLGLDGKPFTILKFRSMRADAEAGGPAWATANDTRVTRVGKYIRLARLDELPQLLNVLRGDMALIGPRPERPHFTEALSAHIPEFRSRLLVKPGITGWAQVNLPYGASVEDARAKLAFDLYYVQNRSLTLAVKILCRTVCVVCRLAGR